MTRHLLPLLIVVVAGCQCREPAKNLPPVLASETRAVVNGAPLTGDDVALQVASGRSGAGKPSAPVTPAQALEDLVQEELMAQRARELGYQADAFDPGAFPPVEARARQRRSLAKQFRMSELLGKTTVTAEEGRAWFDANTAWVQSEFQVQALTVRGREAAKAALAALATGATFDEVAAATASGPAPASPPWAAQRLRWSEVPAPWRAQLETLEAGKTSALIEAPNDEFWIIRLVERKQDPAVTWELVAPTIQATLTAKKFEERRDAAMKELRAKAKVELIGTP